MSSCHPKMPGPPTFVIDEFVIRPEVPDTWSFSALREFEACPMRWALSRTTISGFDGHVPQKPNRGSVEGTLLHELIECFERHTNKPASEKFRPRRTLLELLSAWAKKNEANPRVDSNALAGQVRLDEILRAFSEASNYLNETDHQAPRGAKVVSTHPTVFEGAESWLRDPESKLCGRADFIADGEIIDFKSGEAQDYHSAQVVFYAALYFAMKHKLPSALRLIYTQSGEIREVSVPALKSMEFELSKMRQRALIADRQIATGNTPAQPSPAVCTFCHVRGVCVSYWNSLQHNSLQHESVVDYTPTEMAGEEPAALGVYIRDIVAGVPTRLHLPQAVMRHGATQCQQIRCLSVRINRDGSGVNFTLTRGSEVYLALQVADCLQ